MSTSRQPLPQLEASAFLTDGGIETTLIFADGLDLPDFAAFPLLRDDAGRAALVRYFESYLEVARRDGVGIVLETPTWRASSDWADRLGWSLEELDDANRDSVTLLRDLQQRHEAPGTPVVISGCVGPRGDGYQADTAMTADDAAGYHARQIGVFAQAGADLVTAITMTSIAEATGVAEAARAAGIPVVLSFTVETDGRLPSGEQLGEAIEAVDAATGSYPAYFMVNCAHPTHFAHLLEGAPAWAARLGGVRANASKLSHAELDEAEELDAGDPDELAADYLALRAAAPSIRVLGGCCGTDHRHIGAISAAVAAG